MSEMSEWYCVRIPAEGEPELVPMSGEEFDFRELQRLVDGHFEDTHVHVPTDLTKNDEEVLLIVDEEGKLKGKPLNPLATYMHMAYYECERCAEYDVERVFDPIVGTAILCGLRVFPSDESAWGEMDYAGWRKDEANRVLAYVKEQCRRLNLPVGGVADA